MDSLLGYPGLIGAFILTIAIILPVLVRSLRMQNQSARREAESEREGSRGASSDSGTSMTVTNPPPPVAAVECRACGQMNRVPLDAERALCGRCKGELIGSNGVSASS